MNFKKLLNIRNFRNYLALDHRRIISCYSASGQEVSKLVYQAGRWCARTTVGPYQYEQDSLRFFPHAEGRVLRAVSPVSGAVTY